MDRKPGDPGFQEDGSLSDMEKGMRYAYDLYIRGALLDGAVPPDGVSGWISAAHAEATEILAASTDVLEQIVSALKAKRANDRAVLGIYELAPILQNVQRRPNRVTTADRARHF